LLLNHASVPPTDIAIITPYTAQVYAIRKAMTAHFPGVDLGGLTLGVVNQLQGEERQYVLLSMVHSDEKAATSFVSGDKRCNVALSRHRTLLVVFTNLAAWEAQEGLSRYGSNVVGFQAVQRFIDMARTTGSLHDRSCLRDWLSEINAAITVNNPNALAVEWQLRDSTFSSASQWTVSPRNHLGKYAPLYRWFDSTLDLIRVTEYYVEGNMRYGFDVFSGRLSSHELVNVLVFPFFMQSGTTWPETPDYIQQRCEFAVSKDADGDFLGYPQVGCDKTRGVPPILVMKRVNFIRPFSEKPLDLEVCVAAVRSLISHLVRLVHYNLFHCDIGPHSLVYTGSLGCVRLVNLFECVEFGDTVTRPTGETGSRWNSGCYTTASELRLTFAAGAFCLYCASPPTYRMWMSSDPRQHKCAIDFCHAKPKSAFGPFLFVAASALEYKFHTLEEMDNAIMRSS
jgi:hypothetical protein